MYTYGLLSYTFRVDSTKVCGEVHICLEFCVFCSTRERWNELQQRPVDCQGSRRFLEEVCDCVLIHALVLHD